MVFPENACQGLSCKQGEVLVLFAVTESKQLPGTGIKLLGGAVGMSILQPQHVVKTASNNNI
jgi:hypothetical protein